MSNLSTTCILDYGAGNVKSVLNAFSQLTSCIVSNDVNDLNNASHLILPGVGSFKESMDRIEKNLPVEFLLNLLNDGKPFLGICVGMQVLGTFGIEFVKADGLAVIPGSVSKLNSGDLPLPHVGWNNLYTISDSPITKNIDVQDDFYFTHSFGFTEITSDYVVATTEYGVEFPSIIQKDNIFGVQFHPEKSQKSGVKILSNFLDLQ